ncbi:MAG: metallophosphoesterase [Clostridia bacterium]|nr:metallophosphoesterase [Clostridia bacterium]
MHSMKKLLSVCLTVAMLVSCISIPAGAWEAQTEKVDLRFGVINDSHVTATGNGVPNLTNALSTLKTLGGNDMDGLAFVGDVIYYPSASSDPTDITPYENVYGAVETAGFTKDDIIAYAMGNHEFPQSNTDVDVSNTAINTFETYTGFNMNHHEVVNGYHFIAGGAKDYNGQATAETQEWLMNEIDAAIAENSENAVDGKFPEGVIPDSTEPVFLLLHHPIDGTIFNVSGDKYTDEFVEFLKNRPQIVNITAHWHVAANLPQTIWQDGFTSYQSALVGGGYLEELGATSTGNITYSSQGSMFEVKDGVVRIYRLDYTKGEFIDDPWVIDIPAIVKDRTDDDVANDGDNYLYTDEKREQVKSVAAFPAGTELTASAKGTTVTVTFPNNAAMAEYDEIQQDHFVRGYKVEVVNPNGTVTTSKHYQTDFYKKDEDRAESYTKSISGLAYGTEYTVNVYPWAPLGTYGKPISATVTTDKEVISDSAVRYEFEDHFPYTGIVKKSDLASGGKLVSSNQAGEYVSNVVLPRDEENPVYTFDFNVNLPTDGAYDIRYAASYHTNSTFVSHMTFYVDDVEIGKNDNSYDLDLSLGNTYPWQYTPLMRYKKNVEYLTAGNHKVKVEVNLPTATTQAQPFLFCLDYIEFNPKKAILAPGKTARVEMEDYISGVSFEQTDGTIYTPKTVSSSGCSGSAYAFFDSADGLAPDFVDFEIPVTVQADGTYSAEYVVNAGTSALNIYVDSKDNGPVNTTVIKENLDEKNSEGIFPVFESSWAMATSNRFSLPLTEGEHTLIFELKKRGAGDIALYLDYLELSSSELSVSTKKTTHVNFSDHMEKFTPVVYKWENAAADNGVLAYAGGGNETTFTLPFYAENKGTYQFDHVGAYSANLSDVYVYVDNTEGEPICIINKDNTSFEDLSENGEVYQNKNGWLKKLYRFTADIEAGAHSLIYVVKSRGESLGVAYAFDYVDISGYVAPISGTETTRLELENYADGVTVPQNDGTTYVPTISNGAGASEGKYLAFDSADGKCDVAYVDVIVPINVKTAGMYDMSSVVCFGVSGWSIFVDDTTTDPVLTQGSAYEIIDEVKGEDGKIAYFSSTWAKATKYKSRIELKGGKQDLILRIYPRGGELKDIAVYFDYIEFTPVENNVIAADDVTRFEFEDYTSGNVKKDLAYASGSAVAHNSWANGKPTQKIPVVVEKSGYYDITYVVGEITVDKDGNPYSAEMTRHLSTVTLTIGDQLIGNNKGGYVENLGSVYDVWDTAPVSKYVNKLYLEAGSYVINADVAITADAKYKYTLDYIEFAPATGVVDNGDGTVTVTAAYDAPVSGEAVVALYNGKQLVGVGSAIVADTKLVSVDAPAAAYTEVKVLVLDALTGLKPQAEEVIFEK